MLVMSLLFIALVHPRHPTVCMFYQAKSSRTRGTSLGGVPREQKMLKGHLPRVIYHQVYWYTQK